MAATWQGLLNSGAVEEINVPKLTLNETEEQRTRTFKVEGSAVELLVNVLYPTNIQGGNVSYPNPAHRWPGKPHLGLHNVSIEPFDPLKTDGLDDFGVSKTNYYRAIFTYSTKKAPQLQIFKFEIDFHGEFLRINQSGDKGMTYQESDDLGNREVSQDDDIFMMHPLSTWKVTWFRVLRPPWDKLEKWSGKVNNRRFLLSDSETVLYAGCATEEHYDKSGRFVYDLNYQFEKRAIPYMASAQNFGNHEGDVTHGSNLITFPGGLPEGLDTGDYLNSEHGGGRIVEISDNQVFLDRQIAHNGTTAWGMFREGEERYAGWNHVFRGTHTPGTKDRWQKVDPPVHLSADFRELFKPGDIDLRKEIGIDLGLIEPDDS